MIEVSIQEFYKFMYSGPDYVISSKGAYPYTTEWKTRQGQLVGKVINDFEPKSRDHPEKTRYYLVQEN